MTYRVGFYLKEQGGEEKKEEEEAANKAHPDTPRCLSVRSPCTENQLHPSLSNYHMMLIVFLNSSSL